MTKRSKKSKRTWGRIMTMISLVLVGTASWALYSVVNESVGVLLSSIGIEGPIAQGAVVLVVAVIILMLLGAGLFKAIEKIVSG